MKPRAAAVKHPNGYVQVSMPSCVMGDRLTVDREKGVAQDFVGAHINRGPGHDLRAPQRGQVEERGRPRSLWARTPARGRIDILTGWRN